MNSHTNNSGCKQMDYEIRRTSLFLGLITARVIITISLLVSYVLLVHLKLRNTAPIYIALLLNLIPILLSIIMKKKEKPKAPDLLPSLHKKYLYSTTSYKANSYAMIITFFLIFLWHNISNTDSYSGIQVHPWLAFLPLGNLLLAVLLWTIGAILFHIFIKVRLSKGII